MNTSTPATQWATDWLDSVVDGSVSMSQRRLSVLEKKGGSLTAVRQLAEAKGVHLLLVEDEAGNELVAASLKPFTVIC